MLNRGARAVVLKHFDQFPGINVHLAEILEGSDRKYPEIVIQNAINAMKRDGFNIETVVSGRTWRYKPTVSKPEPAPSAKRMFEEIGTARDGSVIIQDEQGAIYKAVEL